MSDKEALIRTADQWTRRLKTTCIDLEALLRIEKKSDKPTLITMPDKWTRRLLKFLPFNTILNLRKTCRHFNRFIDKSAPLYPNIYGISIACVLQCVCLNINFSPVMSPYPFGGDIRVHYERHAIGTKVTWRRSDGVRFYNFWTRDYMEVFRTDLKVLLRQFHQMKFFRINGHHILLDLIEQCWFRNSEENFFDKVFDSIGVALALCQPRIQPKDCDMTVDKQRHLMNVLSHIDTSDIEKVWIDGVKMREEIGEIEVDEVAMLESLKAVKEIEITRLNLTGFAHFVNFQSMDVRCVMLTQADVVCLKESFVKFSHMKSFKINYRFNDFPYHLEEIFMRPAALVRDPEESYKKMWFFRMTNDFRLVRVTIDMIKRNVSYTRSQPYEVNQTYFERKWQRGDDAFEM